MGNAINHLLNNNRLSVKRPSCPRLLIPPNEGIRSVQIVDGVHASCVLERTENRFQPTLQELVGGYGLFFHVEHCSNA